MKKTLCIILICFSLVLLILGILVCSVLPRQYTTNDIKKYGKFTGNHDNDFPREFTTSFFPEQIETFFSEVAYSYRAQKNDTYAFEAYLEFVIEDTEVFDSFVKRTTEGLESKPFFYDSSFVEYTVSDVFEGTIGQEETDGNTYVAIGYAKIGKILCSKEEQRIIFVALGVYDGGMARSDFLTVYFDRFGIDARNYEGATIRIHNK